MVKWIYISSTYEDLKEERKKVQDIILSMYQFPIGMEMFSAADEEQWEIIKETINCGKERERLNISTGIIKGSEKCL